MQLFGDTVNTGKVYCASEFRLTKILVSFFVSQLSSTPKAARMESHGLPNKIHISRKTAEQLEREGKSHWVTERKELVSAKGKGVLKTFFAEPRSDGSASSMEFSIKSEADMLGMDDLQNEVEFRQRLIDWNVVLLSDLLKTVVAHRKAKKKSSLRNSASSLSLEDLLAMDDSESASSGHFVKSIRDEVLDSIPIPTYEDQRKKKMKGSDSQPIELGERVMEQLRNYIVAIESGYPPNAFHNFSHCTHVVSIIDFSEDTHYIHIFSPRAATVATTGNVSQETPPENYWGGRSFQKRYFYHRRIAYSNLRY